MSALFVGGGGVTSTLMHSSRDMIQGTLQVRDSFSDKSDLGTVFIEKKPREIIL